MAKKTKKDYWMFTVMSDYKALANMWFDEFPTREMLNEEFRNRFIGKYVIVSITKLTEEQYVKLTGKEVSE